MGETAKREKAMHAASPADPDAAGIEVARGRRIRLRQLSYADIPWLSHLYAQPQVQELLLDKGPTRFFEVAARVAWVQLIYEKHRGLGIWRADSIDGEFLGTFSLMPIEATGEVEIGAHLKPEAWGRWYATEGGRLLCRHAFAVLGLPSLVGYFHPDNEVVAHILARIGFRETARSEYAGKPARRYELDAASWGAAEARVRHL